MNRLSGIIFQMYRKTAGILMYVNGLSVQDDGEYPSKFGAKPSGGLCEALPEVIGERSRQ